MKSIFESILTTIKNFIQVDVDRASIIFFIQCIIMIVCILSLLLLAC